MKKKSLLIFLLAAVSTVTVASMGSACKSGGGGGGKPDPEPTHTEHSYVWKSDAAQHWEECSECGEKKSGTGHTDKVNNDTNATGRDGKCDVCGRVNNAVTFDVQGHGTAPAVQYVYEGGKAVKPKTNPEDASGEFTFGGWYADAACNTPFDFTGAVTAPKTVYAKWGVKVTFDMKGYGSAVEEQTVKVGDKAVKPATDPEDENGDYIFEGWFEDSDCETPFNFDTKVINAGTTVYAKWVKDTKLKVTFDVQGHGTAPAFQKLESGDKVKKPADPDVIGWIFEGWFEDEDHNTPFDFDNKQITENTVIYSKWTKDMRKVVSFNVQGFGTAPKAQLVEPGEYATEPAEAPSANGVDFAGWYHTEACLIPFVFEDEEITDDTVIYAKWTVDVTFDTQGYCTAPAKQAVKVGGTVGQTDIPIPEAEGFVFAGWFADPGCNVEFEFDEPVTEAVTVYANWERGKIKLVPDEMPKNYKFDEEETLQFTYTATKDSRFTLSPYSVKTSDCYFTTNLDAAGVYYGAGYDKNEKVFDLKSGRTINVTLYRGQGITDTDKVSLMLEEITNEDFPETGWVSGTYTDGQISITLDKAAKTVTWDGSGPFSLSYLGGSFNRATFVSGTAEYTLKYLKSGSDDVITFSFRKNNVASGEIVTYTLTRVVPQERLDVSVFSGVYTPGEKAPTIGSVKEIGIYESGNGYTKVGSRTDEYKLGEGGSSYTYDGVTNTLKYGNYTITVNLNEEGEAVSINIINPTLSGGNVPHVYLKTDDAPDEPPEKLPLANDIELIGETYSIKNGQFGKKDSAYFYTIKITAYDKANDIYTVSCSNSTYKLKIVEGEEDAVTVYVYDIDDGTLKDTLEKKVVESHGLKMDGTNNVVTPDMVSNNVVTYTIPKSGVYTVTLIDAPSYGWSGTSEGNTHITCYATMFYADYENDPYNYFAYMEEINTPSNKVVLQEGNVFAVNVGEYPAGFGSMTFILEEALPDPGTTPENAIVINGADSKTVNMTADGTYYAKFIAAEDGTYHITLRYLDWGSPSYNIDYKVDGVQYGAVAPDWVSVWTYSYYKDGELTDYDGWNSAPYATVTVTAGQEVSIVFVGSLNYENFTITIEKV